jgi:hypothetical protein
MAARLDAAAAQTNLSRSRIVEHLVERLSTRDLVRLLKLESPKPARIGRPKQSIHKNDG